MPVKSSIDSNQSTIMNRTRKDLGMKPRSPDGAFDTLAPIFESEDGGDILSQAFQSLGGISSVDQSNGLDHSQDEAMTWSQVEQLFACLPSTFDWKSWHESGKDVEGSGSPVSDSPVMTAYSDRQLIFGGHDPLPPPKLCQVPSSARSDQGKIQQAYSPHQSDSSSPGLSHGNSTPDSDRVSHADSSSSSKLAFPRSASFNGLDEAEVHSKPTPVLVAQPWGKARDSRIQTIRFPSSPGFTSASYKPRMSKFSAPSDLRKHLSTPHVFAFSTKTQTRRPPVPSQAPTTQTNSNASVHHQQHQMGFKESNELPRAKPVLKPLQIPGIRSQTRNETTGRKTIGYLASSALRAR